MPAGTSEVRVLIVDDDEAVRSVLELALRRQGFAVAAVCSGKEAIRALSDSPFHVLVIDACLTPGGAAPLVAIARHLYPLISVVGMSGAGALQETPLRGSSIDCFIAKPFSLEKLFSELGRIATDERLTRFNERLR